MHGELAQAIALAAHGSAWLAGITTDASPRLETDNSTFRYVRRVRFELRGSFLRRRPTAAPDVGQWLEGAHEREIERFWLSIPEPDVATIGGLALPERMLVGLAGAGRWSLVGTSSEGSPEMWRASWSVGDPDAHDQRIWEVDYHGKRLVRSFAPLQPEVSASSKRLKAALERAEAFARNHELDLWADWLADARRLGDAEDPEPPYHPDLLPARGFDHRARQLLAMATRSWVFGGMGSWNDLGFATREQTDEYHDVSAELYSAVLRAFVAAVNVELEA